MSECIDLFNKKILSNQLLDNEIFDLVDDNRNYYYVLPSVDIKLSSAEIEKYVIVNKNFTCNYSNNYHKYKYCAFPYNYYTILSEDEINHSRDYGFPQVYLGNTCFFNSLSCLIYHIPELRYAFENYDFITDYKQNYNYEIIKNGNRIYKTSVNFYTYYNLLKTIFNKNSPNNNQYNDNFKILTEELKAKNLLEDTGNPEDPEEFIILIFQNIIFCYNLIERSNISNIKNNDTLLNDSLSFLIKTKATYSKNSENNISDTLSKILYKDFRYLFCNTSYIANYDKIGKFTKFTNINMNLIINLPLPHNVNNISIQELLNRFMDIEKISNYLYQKTYLLPNTYLLINVLRYDYNLGRKKILTKVNIDNINIIINTNNFKYKCVSIIEHKGHNITGGHYVCYIYKKNKWLCYNDDLKVYTVNNMKELENGSIFLYRKINEDNTDIPYISSMIDISTIEYLII